MMYFSHGRTALKFGLKYLDLKPGDSILIPNYICDVVLHPIEEMKIQPYFYDIMDNMEPDWDKLNKTIDKKVKAILIVHYFGHAQNIERIIKFCVQNNLMLIEDNAHGHGGNYNGKLLGTFGDIGFSSLTKIYPINFGGSLFLKNYSRKVNSNVPLPSYNSRVKKLIKRKIRLIPFIESIYRKSPSYYHPIINNQKIIKDMLIDNKSLKVLNSININEYKDHRNSIYKFWEYFALNNGLNPVFDEFKISCMPWVFAAYAPNFEERNKWLDWGYRNNIAVFTWPRLPINIANEGGEALKRWKRLICFPIESWMKLDQLKKKIIS